MDESTTNQSILAAIRNGDQAIVDTLYKKNRSNFLRWAISHSDLDQADILDVFQDAITTFYLMVVEEKIVELNVSADAYFFGIAKRMLYRKANKQQHKIPIDDIQDLEFEPALPQILEDIEINHQQHLVHHCLQQLSKVCREILMLHYFYDHGMEVIADRMGYHDTDTAKSTHYNCKKKLRELVLQYQQKNL